LIHVGVDGASRRFSLQGATMRIGRGEDADIRIEEPLVSRTHASIEKRGLEWVLRDLESRNFTRVNGERIQERALRHGDEILFARARCLFVDDSFDESDAAQSAANRVAPQPGDA
jgi:pSer/pThr/pTyr-binding forkhead associated (FHA) protein